MTPSSPAFWMTSSTCLSTGSVYRSRDRSSGSMSDPLIASSASALASAIWTSSLSSSSRSPFTSWTTAMLPAFDGTRPLRMMPSSAMASIMRLSLRRSIVWTGVKLMAWMTSEWAMVCAGRARRTLTMRARTSAGFECMCIEVMGANSGGPSSSISVWATDRTGSSCFSLAVKMAQCGEVER
jgi:hypothetical protein